MQEAEGGFGCTSLQGAKDGLRGWRFIHYAVSLSVLGQNGSCERQVQLNRSPLAKTGDLDDYKDNSIAMPKKSASLKCVTLCASKFVIMAAVNLDNI